jgi:hypothetical protein
LEVRYLRDLPHARMPGPVMREGPRPEKPYAAYPLHAHASGQWSARINGKARFFGVWADPKGALARYLAYMN